MSGKHFDAGGLWKAGVCALVLALAGLPSMLPHAQAQELAQLSSKKKAAKKKPKPAPQRPAPAAPASSDTESDDDLDLGDPEPVKPAPAPAPPPPRAPEPEPAVAEPEPTPSAEETPAEGEAVAEEAPPVETPPAQDQVGPTIIVQPYAGVGIATRSFKRPVSTGSQSLAATVTPAAEVGLGVVLWPERSFSLSILLAYQSALGFTVTERPPFAYPNEVGARSERVSLDIGPGWKLGPARLSIPIGASMRTLWPEIHTSLTPGYSLIGPHARIELAVLLGGRVSLRISPEAQWIAHIDQSLRATGVSSQGVALGGDVSAGVVLSKAFSVGLNYRQSHALITTNRGFTFSDVERYFTVRIVGTF
ncbi:MAG: hypothetical protein ABW321_20530 [Polyangiales bacterium]